MQKHEKQIAIIIDNTRCGDDRLIHDSKESAKLILKYLSYHFELKEKFDFKAEPLN